MALSVNEKGVIGLVKVIADLVPRRYEVFTPTSDSCPVDIVVADESMTLRRIQVKYREILQRSDIPKAAQIISVDLDSLVNGKRVPIDIRKIDGWAIYCPQAEQVLYVRTDEVKVRSIRISLTDFRGRRCRLASDFLDPARLWERNECVGAHPTANRDEP